MACHRNWEGQEGLGALSTTQTQAASAREQASLKKVTISLATTNQLPSLISQDQHVSLSVAMCVSCFRKNSRSDALPIGSRTLFPRACLDRPALTEHSCLRSVRPYWASLELTIPTLLQSYILSLSRACQSDRWATCMDKRAIHMAVGEKNIYIDKWNTYMPYAVYTITIWLQIFEFESTEYIFWIFFNTIFLLV